MCGKCRGILDAKLIAPIFVFDTEVEFFVASSQQYAHIPFKLSGCVEHTAEIAIGRGVIKKTIADQLLPDELKWIRPGAG